jgi:hypothetical protein
LSIILSLCSICYIWVEMKTYKIDPKCLFTYLYIKWLHMACQYFIDHKNQRIRVRSVGTYVHKRQKVINVIWLLVQLFGACRLRRKLCAQQITINECQHNKLKTKWPYVHTCLDRRLLLSCILVSKPLRKLYISKVSITE